MNKVARLTTGDKMQNDKPPGAEDAENNKKKKNRKPIPRNTIVGTKNLHCQASTFRAVVVDGGQGQAHI